MRFKPCFGRAVMVPLPLCPWYFQSVVMDAKYWCRLFARVGVGAGLLRLLGTCQAVLLWVTPGALDGVRTFNGRTRELPGEAALYFCCKGRHVLLRLEGAFGTALNLANAVRPSSA